MIVYHLTTVDQVPKLLAGGLLRSEKRFYVLPRWDLIEILLEAFALENFHDAAFESHHILVLKVDEDTLMPGPIPQSQLPGNLGPGGQNLLQSQSLYLETDLSRQRIIGVKDAFGNNITKRFQPEAKGTRPVRRFLAYVRPYWPFFALGTTAGFVKFLIPLIFPWVLRIILDDVILNSSLQQAQRLTRVFHLVLGVLMINMVWMGACYLRSICTAVGGHRVIRDLRVALFNHVQRLSHQFFATHQTGAIVSRVVNDIGYAQNFVSSAFTNAWMDSVLLTVLMVVLFRIHAVLACIALSLIPVFLISIRFIGSRIRLVSREVQQRVEVLTGGLQEKISGVSIIKGFNREAEEARAFASQANKLYSKVLRSARYSAINEMLVGFVVLSAPVLVVWYGANQIMQGRLTVGELTQFLLYLGMFYAPIQRLSDLSVLLANSMSAIERIFEYFDIQPQVVESRSGQVLKKTSGHLEFENVFFGYEPDVQVLQRVNLVIRPGETVAFVGPSGSGKSTLANLVPRFYDPTSGLIRLDGHDLRDLKIESLRSHIGIVNQETVLFSGTIRENLLLANPGAAPAEIKEALIAANALEFIEELPERLWTEIGERGVKLSGGQKQRLAIARAFLKNPKILILDEATSALDSKSEHHIQRALSRLLQGRTSIAIAHRLSTVMNADKIVAIDRGRVQEIGTHEQLLEQGGLYAQLYHEQYFHVGRPVEAGRPVEVVG